MELGTLQIQIFVSLVVVLGTAFVAFLCDFLKGNNEQLRERNIELRVRQDERERLGVANPGSLLKGIEALLRNTPGLRVGPAEETAPAAPPAETEPQAPATWEQPVSAPRSSAWASKEELEKLAERAARIRERHESRKAADDELEEEPVVLAPVAKMPMAAAVEELPAAAEILAEAPEVQETPPPLAAEEPEVTASADAEATPVFEPQAVSEVEEPASRIELQPLAATEAPPAMDTPHGTPVHAEDEPAAIAPEPEPVMKPMATATIIPSEPEELLAGEAPTEPETAESEAEPELMRVRVVPIDQSAVVAETSLEAIAPPEPETRLIAAPADDAIPQSVAEVIEAAPAAESSMAEIFAGDAPVEGLTIDTTALESSTEIGSLHDALVAEEPGLPPGLHSADILREQIKANAPFQGVSVSIGVNDYESLRQKLDAQGGSDSLAAIEKMIRGMLKERDFACRFQDDEYILLFPGEADSAAQRRLFQISEKLWDFQLRSLGHHSIMFSWGGLEVKRDSLSDAVASARERMFQTKRNRTGAIEMRKRVVNE